MQTLSEAIEYVDNNLEKGIECPCCGQYCRLYKRKLNATMAVGLVRMYLEYKTDPREWLHLPTMAKKYHEIMSREWAMTRWWGLSEEKPNPDDPKKRCSGYWRLTQKGTLFVVSLVTIPKHVYLFNNSLFAVSDEVTTIEEALGDRFNYAELMRGDQPREENSLE